MKERTNEVLLMILDEKRIEEHGLLLAFVATAVAGGVVIFLLV